MKLIVNIPEDIITAIQNGEDYRYDIHTAIAQGIPYEGKPKGDLISREALKEEASNLMGYVGSGMSPTMLIRNQVLDLIDNAPTIETKEIAEYALAYGDGYQDGHKEGYDKGYHDAERPQGKWLEHKLRNDIVVEYAFKCSNCKEDSGLPYRTDFCPNCGAQMQKEDAE